MPRRMALRKLLPLLRANGVFEYSDGSISLKLGPAPSVLDKTIGKATKPVPLSERLASQDAQQTLDQLGVSPEQAAEVLGSVS